jgi:hypothetical protein
MPTQDQLKALAEGHVQVTFMHFRHMSPGRHPIVGAMLMPTEDFSADTRQIRAPAVVNSAYLAFKKRNAT